MFLQSKMGDELRFQQRWEFRRKDNDLDTDDSKASSEHVLPKQNTFDNENSDASKFQQEEENHNQGDGDQFKIKKTKKMQSKKTKKDDLVNKNEHGKNSKEEANRKKRRTSTYQSVALDDLKIFMESLLEDLKVSRENMLKEMREEMQGPEAEKVVPNPKKRAGNNRRKKVQKSRAKKNKTSSQIQQQEEQNLQGQHENNLEESIQVQHQTNTQETVNEQQLNHFEENIMEQNENMHMQRKNKFKLGTIAQTFDGEPLEKFVSCKANGFSDYCQSLKENFDHGKAKVTMPFTLTDPENEHKLESSSKSISQPSEQKAQMEHSKSIVLGIKAQNGNGGASRKSTKGKKSSETNYHQPASEDQADYSQPGGFMSLERGRGERLSLSTEENFTAHPPNHFPSMFLTLPTGTNHMFDALSSNYIQPRYVNSERASHVLDSPPYRGCFPVSLPLEQRIGNFAQISSRNMNCLNRNSYSASSLGNMFPGPLYHGINSGFNIPSESCLDNLRAGNSKALSSSMNEGAMRFSGGNFAFSQQYVANQLQNESVYKPDSRHLELQIPKMNDQRLFPK